MEQKKKRLSILKKSVRYESSPTQTFTKSNRRISFSGTKSVKEFIPGEDKATIWGTSYEEEDRNHASVGSSQESRNSEISTTSIASSNFGMTLRNHKIIAKNIPTDENKENAIVENTIYDTMELSNTQNIATSSDYRTFNNTMEMTLNSFEFKNIKLTKIVANKNVQKNIEMASEEAMLNWTSSIGLDCDISQNMYCSFTNEQDRKMLLQKASKKGIARDNAEENNLPNRFECEIENFTFNSACANNKRPILIDKNNSDSLNISLEISPPKPVSNAMSAKEMHGRKTILFQAGEVIDAANHLEKCPSVCDSAETRKTILFNEELTVDKSPVINKPITIEVIKFENNLTKPKCGEMDVEPLNSPPQENDCKRKTIVFPKGENIHQGLENGNAICGPHSNRQNRQTVIFPMGEPLAKVLDTNLKTTHLPCRTTKSRETMIFERGQDIDKDPIVHPNIRSDLPQKNHVSTSANIETETTFNSTQSQEFKENMATKISDIRSVCPSDTSRKTIIFTTAGQIDETLYKSPLLWAQSKRMTKMFMDAKMEVDECLNATQFDSSHRQSKARNSSKKQSQSSKSRQTKIFPTGEKIDETISLSQSIRSDPNCTTSEFSAYGRAKMHLLSKEVTDTITDRQTLELDIDQQAKHPIKSRQTLVFEAGEKIDLDFSIKSTFPEDTERLNNLFRNVDSSIENCTNETPANVVKDRRTLLNECTMNETLCINRAEDIEQHCIFDRIMANPQSKPQLVEGGCKYSEPILEKSDIKIEQFNQSAKNQTFKLDEETFRADHLLEETSNRGYEKQNVQTDKSAVDMKKIYNRTTAILQEGETVELVERMNKKKSSFDAEKSTKMITNEDQDKFVGKDIVQEKLQPGKDRKTMLCGNEDIDVDNFELHLPDMHKPNPNRKTTIFNKDERIAELLDKSKTNDNKPFTENQSAAIHTKLQTTLFTGLDVSKDHATVSRKTLVFGDADEQLEVCQKNTRQQPVRRATCLFDNEDIDIETDINAVASESAKVVAREQSKDDRVEAYRDNTLRADQCTKSFISQEYSVDKTKHIFGLHDKRSDHMQLIPQSSLVSDNLIGNQTILPKTNCVQEDLDISFEDIASNKTTSKLIGDEKKHARRTIVYQHGELVELSKSIITKDNVDRTLKDDIDFNNSLNNRPLRNEHAYQSKTILHDESILRFDPLNIPPSPQTMDMEESASKISTQRGIIDFGKNENIPVEVIDQDGTGHENAMKQKSRIPISCPSKLPKAIQPHPRSDECSPRSVSIPEDGHKITNETSRRTQIFKSDNDIETENPSARSPFQLNLERKTVITRSPGKHLGFDKDRSEFMQTPVSGRKDGNLESKLLEMTFDETKNDVDYRAIELSRRVQKVRRTIYFNEEIEEDLGKQNPVDDVICQSEDKISQHHPHRSVSRNTTKIELCDSLVQNCSMNVSHNENSSLGFQSHILPKDESIPNQEKQKTLHISHPNRRTFNVANETKDNVESSDFVSNKTRETFVIFQDRSNETLKDISHVHEKTHILDDSEHPTKEVNDSPVRTHRGTFVLHSENVNQRLSEISSMGRKTFSVNQDLDDQRLEEDEFTNRRGFENNSPTSTCINPNLFKKLTQDSIYLSRTACCPMGTESLLATGSSLTFSPNSTAALCNMDPNKITGAGYKRSFSKNRTSDDTCYKQMKRDYAELTIDALRESPDQYDELDEGTADDIDKTHIDLVNSISDSFEKIEVCEASVMLLDAVESNEQENVVAMQQSQLLCNKCKNCQKTILNDTTLAGFNLEKDLQVVELNFDVLKRLEGKPRFRDVLNEFKERRLSNCFNSTYEESILFPAVPSAEFLLDNYAEGYMQKLEEENSSDGIIEAVCPVIPPFEILFRNRLREKGHWIFDDANLPIGVLECRHKTVRGIRLIVRFQPQDLHDVNTSQINFSQVLLKKCNIYKNPSPFDRAVHSDILSRISRDLTAYCCSSSKLFVFLDNIHSLFLKSYQLVKALLKTIFSNYALLQCDESNNCIVRKTVCRSTGGRKVEFHIRIRNVDKICADDILLPPRSYFREDISSLPAGIDFIKIFLSDPIKYLK